MATKKKNASKGKVVKAAAPKNAARQLVAAKAVSKPRTKSEILNTLAGATGLTRKDVTNIFTAMQEVIGLDVGKKGPGLFTMPGLMKIVRHTKPATKARKGINPFTGEEMVFKAKPARNAVKIRALKALKTMV